MTTQKKRLLIMSAAVAAMLGMLLLLTLDCSDCGSADSEYLEESEHDNSGETSDSDSKILLKRESDEMESFTIENTEGTYHIRRGADGSLTIDELSGLPIDEDFVEMAWFDILEVNYTMQCELDEDLASLASFGLDKPQTVVRCAYTDGTESVIKMGNFLTDEDEICYFRIDDDPNIYVGSFHHSIFQGDTYWLEDDFFDNASSDDITVSDIRISGGFAGGTIVLNDNSTSEPWQKLYGYKYLLDINGFVCAADDYETGLFIDELTSMAADEAVKSHPTAEDKEKYGLTNPDLIISHKRNGKPYTIRISKYDYDELYCIVDGIDVIYRLVVDTYPICSSFSSASLRSTDVFKLYFETAESFKVSTADNIHEFSLYREKLQSTGESELYGYSMTCGGNSIELSAYKSLLEVFNSAAALSYGDNCESDVAVLTIDIEYFDERREAEHICFYPAGTRRYRCLINGSGDAVVSEMWLTRFMSDVQTVANGGTAAI